MNNKNLLLIVGPTAVGKTALSVNLAQEFSCEVISCDSRQFYKELNIGTAKPSLEEMKGVKHYFINSHSIKDRYSAGDFERDVDVLLDELFKKTDFMIMTGGSGLYVNAVLNGLDNLPEIDEKLRTDLMEQLSNDGVEVLAEKLKEFDLDTYNSIDIQNSQRVVRALEVCLLTGKPFSSFKKKTDKKLNYNVIKIGLELPRDLLYQRINDRVDAMISAGLVAEVEELKVYRANNALQTVGYKEVFAYLNNELSYENMIDLIKRNTRRYAKRQLTWFKNQDDYQWFSPQQLPEIISYIKKLSEILPNHLTHNLQ